MQTIVDVLSELDDLLEELRKFWRGARKPQTLLEIGYTKLEYVLTSFIIDLLNLTEEEDEILFCHARNIRKKYAGDTILLRGGIEISNICRLLCLFCGMNRELQKSEGYKQVRATPEQIVAAAEAVYSFGIRNFFIQSGEDKMVSDIVLEALALLRRRHPDWTWEITLNLGIMDDCNVYEKFRDAGVTKYLMKQETANKLLHLQHRGETLERRVKHMILAHRAGLIVGVGNILGLPGQTDEHLADDVLFACRFMGSFGPQNGKDVMVSCAPYIPSSVLREEYSNYPPGDFKKYKRYLAILRIVFPEGRIPSVSAVDDQHYRSFTEALSGQAQCINAGANGITVKFSPKSVQENYRLYDLDQFRYIVSPEVAFRVSQETGLPLDLIEPHIEPSPSPKDDLVQIATK